MYGIVSRAVDADKLEDEVASFCETLLRRPRPGDSWSQGIFAIRATHGCAGRARLRAQHTSMIKTAAAMKE